MCQFLLSFPTLLFASMHWMLSREATLSKEGDMLSWVWICELYHDSCFTIILFPTWLLLPYLFLLLSLKHFARVVASWGIHSIWGSLKEPKVPLQKDSHAPAVPSLEWSHVFLHASSCFSCFFAFLSKHSPSLVWLLTLSSPHLINNFFWTCFKDFDQCLFWKLMAGWY